MGEGFDEAGDFCDDVVYRIEGTERVVIGDVDFPGCVGIKAIGKVGFYVPDIWNRFEIFCVDCCDETVWSE